MQKKLARMHTLLQGFGGYTHGCASAPHGTSQHSEGKKVLRESLSLCESLQIPLQRLEATVRDSHRGPLKRGKSPLPKNKQSNATTNHLPCRPKQKRPTTQKASAAHQTTISRTPRANLRLARGAGTVPRNSSPRSRVWRPLNVSLPR
jgi:hypothetical protein